MAKVAPRPGLLITEIRPPWRSTSARQIASPRPTPGAPAARGPHDGVPAVDVDVDRNSAAGAAELHSVMQDVADRDTDDGG